MTSRTSKKVFDALCRRVEFVMNAKPAGVSDQVFSLYRYNALLMVGLAGECFEYPFLLNTVIDFIENSPLIKLSPHYGYSINRLITFAYALTNYDYGAEDARHIFLTLWHATNFAEVATEGLRRAQANFERDFRDCNVPFQVDAAEMQIATLS